MCSSDIIMNSISMSTYTYPNTIWIQGPTRRPLNRSTPLRVARSGPRDQQSVLDSDQGQGARGRSERPRRKGVERPRPTCGRMASDPYTIRSHAGCLSIVSFETLSNSVS